MNIAFDIDNTLYTVVDDSTCETTSPYNKLRRFHQILNYKLIQVMLWHKENGDIIWIWSAGGREYAQSFVNKYFPRLGINVLEKKKHFGVDGHPAIDICYDDQVVDLAKVNILVKTDYKED